MPGAMVAATTAPTSDRPSQVMLRARPGLALEGLARSRRDRRQQVIDALPPVIFHTKRFYDDKEVAGVVKVGKRVGFGAELGVGAVRDQLFGAIYHHGVAVTGGHPAPSGAGRDG
ncbi:hypothetical protein B0H11DRAFT_1932848 [Mycena galericulata]|nr:hypothetical protein B0H11DRAFT_1932848 [Mycena galericulata]